MREIEGMSVLITGGGSGIGAGTARYLAAKGCAGHHHRSAQGKDR